MSIRITAAMAAAGLMVLGACATDPNGNPMGMNRTQQGAIAGAAVGALYGATRDKDKNNQGADAIKGALVGAAAGAVAGNILDRQAAALQQSVSNPNIQIVNHGSYLQVIMPEGILFATDFGGGDRRGAKRSLRRRAQPEPISEQPGRGCGPYRQYRSRRL